MKNADAKHALLFKCPHPPSSFHLYSPTILWSFGGDELRNDSVFTITTEDGSYMIQNGGDSPQPSMRSILTIDFPNKTHEGAYFCSAGSSLSRINLQVLEVMEGKSQVSVCSIK